MKNKNHTTETGIDRRPMSRRTFFKTTGVAAGTLAASSMGAGGALAEEENGDDDDGSSTPITAFGAKYSITGAAIQALGGLFSSPDTDDVEDAIDIDTLGQMGETFRRVDDNTTHTVDVYQDIAELMKGSQIEDATTKALRAVDNEGLTQQEAIDVGVEAAMEEMANIQRTIIGVDDEGTTVGIPGSFWRVWNNYGEIHSEIENDLELPPEDYINFSQYGPNGYWLPIGTREITLVDGSTVDAPAIAIVDAEAGETTENVWSIDSADEDNIPVADYEVPYNNAVAFTPYGDGDNIGTVGSSNTNWNLDERSRLDFTNVGTWRNLWDEIEAVADDIEANVSATVEGAYESIQSGELDFEDFLTVGEIATRMVEEEEVPWATATLMAANLDVEPSSNIEISTTLEGEDWILSGLIMADKGPESWTVGESYQPSELEGAVYLSYRTSDAIGEFERYVEGIDGGEIVFQSAPDDGMEYHIQTTHGESIILERGDFEERENDYPDGPRTWHYDASEDLEQPVSSISQVAVVFPESATDWLTTELRNEFEILDASVDGESTDEINPDQPFEFTTADPDDYDQDVIDDARERRTEFRETVVEIFEDTSIGNPFAGVGDWISGLFGNFRNAIIFIGAIFLALLALSASG